MSAVDEQVVGEESERGIRQRDKGDIALDETVCLDVEDLAEFVQPGDLIFTAGDSHGFDRLVLIVDGLWSHVGIVAGKLGDLHGECSGGDECQFKDHPMPVVPPEGFDPKNYKVTESCTDFKESWVVVHQRLGGLVIWQLDFIVAKYAVVGLLRLGRDDTRRKEAGSAAFKAWCDFPGDNAEYGWGALATAGLLAAKADFREIIKALDSHHVASKHDQVDDLDETQMSPEEFNKLLEVQEKVDPWTPNAAASTSCAGLVQRVYRANGGDVIKPAFLKGTVVRDGRVYDVPNKVTLEALLQGERPRVMDAAPVEDHPAIEAAFEEYRAAPLKPVKSVDTVSNWEMLKLGVSASVKKIWPLRGGAVVEDATSPNDLWHSPETDMRVLVKGLADLENYPKEYAEQVKFHNQSGCTAHPGEDR